MPRYASRTRAGGWLPLVAPDDHNNVPEEHLPDLTVDGPRGPVKSGLLDAEGNELFRLPEPVGFHHPLKD